MKFEYAVTMKKTRNPVSKQHYCDALDRLRGMYKVGNVHMESTRGLHCHFVIKSDFQIKYTEIAPSKRGWNVKAVPLYNRRGWDKYCRKDHDKYNPNIDFHDSYEEFIEDDEQLKVMKASVFKKYRDEQKD